MKTNSWSSILQNFHTLSPLRFDSFYHYNFLSPQYTFKSQNSKLKFTFKNHTKFASFQQKPLCFVVVLSWLKVALKVQMVILMQNKVIYYGVLTTKPFDENFQFDAYITPSSSKFNPKDSEKTSKRHQLSITFPCAFSILSCGFWFLSSET